MISEDPDEDADDLTDTDVLETFGDSSALTQNTDAAIMISDWPGSTTVHTGLNVDPETIAWFRDNHADWRAAIQSVLRAWVNTQHIA